MLLCKFSCRGVSEKRNWWLFTASDLGVSAGSWDGIWTGLSAFPSITSCREGILAGKCGVYDLYPSVICEVGQSSSQRLAHQSPPITGRRSKTRTLSNACSFTSASVAIAPAGPAPMTATVFALIAMIVYSLQNFGKQASESFWNCRSNRLSRLSTHAISTEVKSFQKTKLLV